MVGEIKLPHLHILSMAFVKTTNRRDAYHALVNTILKDPRVYCNNCGATFFSGMERCCEDPQIGTNADVAFAIALQCKDMRDMAKNEHASTDGKTVRLGLSLPVFIYEALDSYERGFGRKLIDGDKDVNFLMRCFPQFRIPRRI